MQVQELCEEIKSIWPIRAAKRNDVLEVLKHVR